MCEATTHRTFTWIALCGIAVLGCATARSDHIRDRASMTRGPSTLTDSDPLIALARPGSDVLTAAEWSATPTLASSTAYDVVMRLRPTYLDPRSARAGSLAGRGLPPAVFVDGMHSGGPEALRLIPAATIKEVRYVRPTDALHRYGPSYSTGVIVVRLRR